MYSSRNSSFSTTVMVQWVDMLDPGLAVQNCLVDCTAFDRMQAVVHKLAPHIGVVQLLWWLHLDVSKQFQLCPSALCEQIFVH